MNFSNSDWRQRRNILNQSIPIHTPMHYTIANFSTIVKKDQVPFENMKTSFEEVDLLARFPNLLQKNLGDTVNIEEKNLKNKKMSLEVEDLSNNPREEQEKSDPPRHDFYPSLTGIAGFFSSFFGALSGAMFHKRPKSPASQYYDCFDYENVDDCQGAPHAWQAAKNHDQNKSGWPGEQFSSANDSMNNCRAAAAHCEDKLNSVRNILINKSVPNTPKKPLVHSRRPKKVFVEPGAVEDNFEDAFSPEDYISLANEDYIEYISVRRNPTTEVCEVEASKTKTESIRENTDIVSTAQVVTDNLQGTTKPSDIVKTEKTAEMVADIVDNTVGNIVKPQSTNVGGFTTKLKEVEGTSNATQGPEKSVQIELKLPNDAVVQPKVVSKPSQVPKAVESKVVNNCAVTLTKEITSSCEDKMAKLKSLLQSSKNSKKATKTVEKPPELTITDVTPVMVNIDRKDNEKPKKSSKTIPIGEKEDSRPSREKRRRSRKPNLHDDVLFAHEIDSEDISSVENSPKFVPRMKNLTVNQVDSNLSTTPDSGDEKQYFNEIKGRFHSSSTTDSEDSFQIVFSDSPKAARSRKSSDCESEDSFIVFDKTPDTCYTTGDVFGDESMDESDDESDSELESDPGCTEAKMSHSFSRSIADLTDGSLYDDLKVSGDELDCAVRVGEEVLDVISDVEESKGLLMNEARKLKKKNQPKKTVTFSPAPAQVRVMRVWAFASRQARAGDWETHARDRERFKRRIADADMALSWVLKPQHRSRVLFQRIMPWRTQQKRKELAEKKQKEEEERLKKEAEEKERLEREELAKSDEAVENVKDAGIDNTNNIDSNTELNKDKVDDTQIVDNPDNKVDTVVNVDPKSTKVETEPSTSKTKSADAETKTVAVVVNNPKKPKNCGKPTMKLKIGKKLNLNAKAINKNIEEMKKLRVDVDKRITEAADRKILTN